MNLRSCIRVLDPFTIKLAANIWPNVLTPIIHRSVLIYFIRVCHMIAYKLRSAKSVNCKLVIDLSFPSFKFVLRVHIVATG
jgi:hypothetical protein